MNENTHAYTYVLTRLPRPPPESREDFLRNPRKVEKNYESSPRTHHFAQPEKRDPKIQTLSPLTHQ